MGSCDLRRPTGSHWFFLSAWQVKYDNLISPSPSGTRTKGKTLVLTLAFQIQIYSRGDNQLTPCDLHSLQYTCTYVDKHTYRGIFSEENNDSVRLGKASPHTSIKTQPHTGNCTPVNTYSCLFKKRHFTNYKRSHTAFINPTKYKTMHNTS